MPHHASKVKLLHGSAGAQRTTGRARLILLHFFFSGTAHGQSGQTGVLAGAPCGHHIHRRKGQNHHQAWCGGVLDMASQPPTVACEMGAQLEHEHIAYMFFFARFALIRMLGWCLVTVFLHRSSVRSLLRVRCWSGRANKVTDDDVRAISPTLKTHPHPNKQRQPPRSELLLLLLLLLLLHPSSRV